MEIYRGFALILFYGLYLHKRHIDNKSLGKAGHKIILCAHLMLLSVLIGGCVKHLVYQACFGVQATYLLLILWESNLDNNQNAYDYLGIVCFVVLWMFLRVATTQTWHYGVGMAIAGITYGGVWETLECWNCTYWEFIVVPLIWLFY